jgi:hypothetical protein
MTPNLHQTAKQVADRLLNVTPAESQFLRCVSVHETRYGDKWTGAGVGSNNWGAITGKGDAGSFQHGDSAPTTSGVQKYVTSFAKYSSPEAGAAAMATTLLKPFTRQAIAKGDLLGSAAAMYAYGYYAGFSTEPSRNVIDYANAITRALGLIVSATGEAPLLQSRPNYTLAEVETSWAGLGTGVRLSSGVLRRVNPTTPIIPTAPQERHLLIVEITGSLPDAIARSAGNPIAAASLRGGTWTQWRKT